MALYTVSTGGTINAADINQLVNSLQRSSGQSEVGHYFLFGSGYATNATVSASISTLSKGATPVSSSFDTSIFASTGIGAITIAHLDSYGFQIYAQASSAGTGIGAAGAFTINY